MYLLGTKTYVKIQNFILKHKIVLVPCLCVSAMLVILLSSNTKKSQSDPTQLTQNPVEPLAYTCCTPLNNSLRTNVYFLKTHKTGSTTVENLILRFALMNSLDVMNIIYTTYYLPFSDRSIYSHTRPPNDKYHILAHHVRYDSKLKSYQYPDTSTVTILRHPVAHFKSKYDFFQLNLLTGMSLKQFLNAPVKPPLLVGVDSFMAYRGYNQMSVDLGFDVNQSRNQTAIAEFIEKIDREFDLVMIMEFMEASIILLANLMGWPIETVAHLKLNARLPDSNSNNSNLTLREEFTIMDLNEVDTQLYHHFRNKFLKCVRQYGPQKMNDQIQRLKTINERFYHRCVSDDVKYYTWYGFLKTIEYTPKNQSDLECVYATTNPIILEDIVRNEQFDRLQRQRKI
ncbi:galactose-3-O-sulfotransferase 3-like [Planococcus citri]|uniref:galactose-3-O-sulfotransferase 3-like n=1 Tax=Planococcus citri TaxID=170843 RepID=UPI0031F7B8B4